LGKGQRCTCDSCEFEFSSGHSHHTGAADAVCTQCDARFCLPTKSAWGPDFDELIELHTVRKEQVKHRGRKKHLPRLQEVREPAGQHIMAVPIAVEGLPYPRVHYVAVDELECTNCKSKGRIVLDFSQRDACPRCKSGRLQCIEVLY
jgi:hypothetical protein